MHGYYGHQHIGHHASLGACSLHDIGGSPDDGKLPDMSKLFFAPDSDGDGLAVGPLSYGNILQQWRTRYLDADAVIDRIYIDQTESGRHLHDVHPLIKLVGASWGHFMHWTLMALGIWAEITIAMGLLIAGSFAHAFCYEVLPHLTRSWGRGEKDDDDG